MASDAPDRCSQRTLEAYPGGSCRTADRYVDSNSTKHVCRRNLATPYQRQFDPDASIASFCRSSRGIPHPTHCRPPSTPSDPDAPMHTGRRMLLRIEEADRPCREESEDSPSHSPIGAPGSNLCFLAWGRQTVLVVLGTVSKPHVRVLPALYIVCKQSAVPRVRLRQHGRHPLPFRRT